MRQILHRLWQSLLVLLVVSSLTFWLLSAAGGDAVSGLDGHTQMSPETRAELRRIYGLDRPLPVRYGEWLANVLRGNLGHSVYFHAPVSSLLWPRLRRTLTLSALALFLAWAVALPLGIAAARRPKSWLDRFCSALILFASSAPRLLLALAMLTAIARASLFREQAAYRLLLAACVLATPLLALALAQTRSRIGEALEQDFVRTAYAKGLSKLAILWRYILRPSIGPLLTVFGTSLGSLLSGSVIVERVLYWPGLGQMSVLAVTSRDVPLLLGIVLVASAAVLLSNLLADLCWRWNDPRVR